VIVAAACLVLLAAGIPLIAQLRSLDTDRDADRRTLVTLIGPTATRVAYSVLVVIAFALLPVAWAVGAIPTGGLAPILSAPLAVRLGDHVSHRAGRALETALRDGVLLVLLFAALYAIGSMVIPD
jgi:1,4-dihydroxy-2-naphthoate polyprenyltransferase